MRRYTAILTLFALNSAALFPSYGREPDEPATLHADVRLVLLDVSVKDRAGTFVPGLSKDDFSVFENGRAQSIKVFTSHDLPVTVGVLVDASLSMAPKRYEVLRAAEIFLAKSNPKDEAFVLTFNEKVRRGLPEGVLFSSNLKQLHDALYRGKPAGKTALNDAVMAGLKQLQTGTRDRRTLIVISDGGDNASEHGRQEMLQQVDESMATIYTIGIYDPGSEDRDPALLRKLAKVSGGEAYFPVSLAQMTDVCTKIAEDVRQRYTVGYTPPPPEADSGEMRQVRLRVKGPGNAKLFARARTSYRYDGITDKQTSAK